MCGGRCPGVPISGERCAGANEKAERDGHDKSSLFGTVCNLNRHNAYGVLVAIFRIASEAVLAGQVLQQHIATASRGSDVVGA